jgi:iron-sulfur cluster repair protein YtfE (RIC family)
MGVAMVTEEKRICDVVAGSPEAEDVLEDAGIDYWFGWEQMLGAACGAANVNPDELARRLVSCRPSAAVESQPATLARLLADSDEQWRATLAPAIATALAAAARVTSQRGDVAIRLLKELQVALERHMTTSQLLLVAAEAIEQAQAGSVDQKTLRSLRLEHLDFARLASGLRAEAVRLASDAEAGELVAAMRTVIRETHRHLKVAYNFILPRLVPAAVARPVAGEPW